MEMVIEQINTYLVRLDHEFTELTARIEELELQAISQRAERKAGTYRTLAHLRARVEDILRRRAALLESASHQKGASSES